MNLLQLKRSSSKLRGTFAQRLFILPEAKMNKPMLTPIQQQFRDAMASLSAAVNIITTNGSAGKCGLTATAVCSITDSPPTLMIAVNRHSKTNATLKENGVVCINILAKEHEETAKDFAGFTQLDIEERFKRHAWCEGEYQLPVLEDSLANLQGKIIQTMEMGTHSLFFIEISSIKNRMGGAALAYFSRAFHAIGEDCNH